MTNDLQQMVAIYLFKLCIRSLRFRTQNDSPSRLRQKMHQALLTLPLIRNMSSSSSSWLTRTSPALSVRTNLQLFDGRSSKFGLRLQQRTSWRLTCHFCSQIISTRTGNPTMPWAGNGCIRLPSPSPTPARKTQSYRQWQAMSMLTTALIRLSLMWRQQKYTYLIIRKLRTIIIIFRRVAGQYSLQV
jgi:hypothetical protein